MPDYHGHADHDRSLDRPLADPPAPAPAPAPKLIHHEPPYPVIDCGSGHHYGICPKCGKAHGQVLVSTSPEN